MIVPPVAYSPFWRPTVWDRLELPPELAGCPWIAAAAATARREKPRKVAVGGGWPRARRTRKRIKVEVFRI